MAKYVVNIDVGELPQIKADAIVKNIRDLNSNAFDPGDKVFFMQNRKGYTSVEALPQNEKYIFFSSDAPAGIDILQTQLDNFFGNGVIKVIYSSGRNGDIATVRV